MGRIDRYIFRTSFGAFALILISLTAVIWITQALRDIDLITGQGQTVLVFVGLTGLIIPLLMLVIAPIALLIAIAYTINKLNTDSEIVVMNAAGMAPWRLFRPFLGVAVIVALLVAALAAYISPWGLRELRDWATKVKTDVVANIVQPGRFITIEPGLTFHLRERRPNGQLVGIFMDDTRDPKEHATFLAEYGEIVESNNNNFMLLYNGSMQRLEAGKLDPTIVLFDRHAFDLSHFNAGGPLQPTVYGARERSLADLLNPDPADRLVKTQPGQLNAELHDRLTAPFYPIAFVTIAFAILGAPRTSRQSRAFSLGLAVAGIAALRFIGFAGVVFAVHTPSAVFLIYASLAVGTGWAIVAISRNAAIEPPAILSAAVNAVTERLTRRLAPT
ncbi:MAG: LPS export ABC transporter permease LptF [Hyphomicrobiales bacterium]|nr:LPS export ABC transporter permease LptF [Hyphomicrobiales bacterium]MBV8826589.1 LPS export ABC transporter permease LptF [Hyphomicrobiales bacterium]MBV9428286.1 LPS export ABC transporter permease LptF [Bradyrhizobiaceae bacterium]